MAYAANINSHNSGFLGGVVKLFNALVSEIQLRKVYKATHNELSALSTRELDDLGISRSDIDRIARDAAYGA